MSKPASFTEAQMRRAITAAEKKGYRVGGIRPDGTVLVYSGDERPSDLSVAPKSRKSREVASWDDR